MSAPATPRNLHDIDQDNPALAALQLAVTALIRTHPDRDMLEEALSHGVDVYEERALREAKDDHIFQLRSQKITQTRQQLACYLDLPGEL